MSLKWKLLIPFLMLSVFGTTSIVLIAVRSQRNLINHAELIGLEAHYKRFLAGIAGRERQAVGLATVIASDSLIQTAFERRDRRAVLDHLRPTYESLREIGVSQIHFHLPSAVSFLRLPRPDRSGAAMEAYRPMIVKVMETRRPVAGLERGDTGYAIRGVVPIVKSGKLLGSVEVDFSFDESFLNEFKSQYHFELTLFVPDRAHPGRLTTLATTLGKATPPDVSMFGSFVNRKTPVTWTPIPDRPSASGLLGPVTDFEGRVVALAELRHDRSGALALLKRSRSLMALVEVVGILLASLVIWFLVHRFLLPIREMVRGAGEIASGDRMYIPVRGRDEMGRLARALNNMVGYLEASRQQMREYATNLETEVQSRTRQLQQSEKKYRALVENVPLVVYQMTPERRLTFVNQYARMMLGVEPSRLLSVSGSLDQLIHPLDREHVLRGFDTAIRAGHGWIGEYRMQTPQNRLLYVRDHAQPMLDPEGRVIVVDGILVDATDQRKLQEKTIQTEELRTLGEVSARLAHEIRNPLTSIGGLSRRLLRELSEDHPTRGWVEAIVAEVQRLEAILRMILSYIQPVDVQMAPGNLRSLMEGLLKDLKPEFIKRNRGLSWTIEGEIPMISMDQRLLRKAMEDLCRHTLFFMDEGETLRVWAGMEYDRIHIRWNYVSSTISSDDLEHYFYPFVSQGPPDPALVDLPFAKIILNKHGGLVQVYRDSGNEIILSVTFPAPAEKPALRPPDER